MSRSEMRDAARTADQAGRKPTMNEWLARVQLGDPIEGPGTVELLRQTRDERTRIVELRVLRPRR
jgi:hypothetical protein